MKVVDICNYRGRNIYSHQPVIKMTVDLGEFTEIPTRNLAGFNHRLLQYFPGLKGHCCSPGYQGGFVQRLIEGTLLSHVIEHVALELQCISGYDVCFGKTRVIKEPSTFDIIYEYINQHCAADFGYDALEIAVALIDNDIARVDDILRHLYRKTLKTDLGPSTKAILAEAKKRYIPYRQLGRDSLFQLGYGKYRQFIEASLPGSTGSITVDLAKNKQLLKDLLSEQRIPVPRGGIALSESEAFDLARDIGYPVVAKPLDGNHGRGVTVNIGDERALKTAYRLAGSYSGQVIIEEYFPGKDYRILVVGDQVAAAAERRPPFIIGDGSHSILELIEAENQNLYRGIGHEKPLTKIYLDAVSEEFLQSRGLTVYDIPARDEVVYLRENGNLSTGGSARDCTGEIHADNKEIAVKAAKIIDLAVAGIDIVADDISRPFTQQNAAVIEVNAAPGLRMHLYPSEGQGINVAADILDHMYPPGTPASIPVVSITGTNGKTTVTRMMHYILSLTGKKVGMTCSSGTFIGKDCIARGDNTGPLSAKSILYNPDIEIALLETARGGMISKGLGYDLADVGMITNISDDHLGLDGIDTLQELAFVKSLVIEALKPNGYAILNADDELTEIIREKVKCNLVLFSHDRLNPLLANHIKQGKTAVVCEGQKIFVYENKSGEFLLAVDEIPITFGGKALFNIDNSLAVIAGLMALNTDPRVIRIGLQSFMPDIYCNAGRLNLFNMGGFNILVDYGHNLSGYAAVLQFAKTMEHDRLVGVIGMPGDRMNESIFAVGKLCGQTFAKIYIKEDRDLRGRDQGMAAGILYHGVVSGGAQKENIAIILSETVALEAAINAALPGDLIIIFYEDFAAVAELILNYMKLYAQSNNLHLPLMDAEQNQLPLPIQ